MSRRRWASDSVAYANRVVTARIRHRCWNCNGVIQPGETYLRQVDFPNWETNQSDAPRVARRHHRDCEWGQP